MQVSRPRRILMTVDAVGGVWRYAMDLAKALRPYDVETVFAGLGPPPSAEQSREACETGTLTWLNAPLDWTTESEDRLNLIPDLLAGLIEEHSIDLLHLNLPSQAACLDIDLPVVVVSHSCVVTWFDSVRGCDVPVGWLWQERRNRLGFDRADAVMVPSSSHAGALRRCYGPIANLEVVYNSCRFEPPPVRKEEIVLAAGRWWDEGKNGAVLDQAASLCRARVLMAGPTEGPAGQHFAIRNAVRLGELPHQEVTALMAKAAIVASPSLYEPFGLAALEGARAGAALVLADIPTYRELWNGAALFANPRHPRSFADAIDRLVDDGAMRTAIGELAQRRSGEFSAGAQCQALLNVYARAMQRSGSVGQRGKL
ncbi:glycosyltransferase family 4 protein [Rhizobium sp. NXC24]|uniref:glycosyltransferase family 4 protein n=1 Tax=Rhizobium sp. NXC24 TaxID=2048897 RepID=UPI001FE1CE77|nr:glycosyltransferase family 4 protein [Rhizobium sp. NXC24]